MSKQTAFKLNVEVGPDHTIKLPDEVPVGPAEVIVFMTDDAGRSNGEPPEALGLFKDEPELVDEVMTHVRELRSRSRMRPAP
jgi:hypothetical protein